MEQLAHEKLNENTKDISFPCMLGPDLDENEVLDFAQDKLDQFAIEITLLKKLAITNGLNYFLPLNEVNNQWLLSTFMSCLKTENTNNTYARITFDFLVKAISDQPNLISNLIFRHFLKNNSDFELKWDLPKHLILYKGNMLRCKNNMLMDFPFIESNQCKTMPELPLGHKYLLSVVDYENPFLQSKLLDAYTKNVSLTLENIISSDKSVSGATLILKGRISREILLWLRGSSPLEPSPIPHIEIIYAIPVLTPELLVSPHEYLFTLKKGKKYRLLKNNKGLTDAYSKDIYRTWQELRSYIVVDELINSATANSSEYSSFILEFWSKFKDIHSPQKDIPHWDRISVTSDEETKQVIFEKINQFRELIEKESSDKNKQRAGKAKRLLELLNEKNNFEDEILARVKEIAEKIDLNKKELFYMDWTHIIYDIVKGKNYNKTYDTLESITPALLTEHNHNYQFYTNRCFIRFRNKEDGDLEFSFSEIPMKSNSTEISCTKLFNWTLLNIIMFFSQLNCSENDSKLLIASFLEHILKNIEISHHQVFIKFINAYKQKNEPIDCSLILTTLTSEEDLKNLITSNTAYVRSGNKLFFVNKFKKIESIKVSKYVLINFDLEMDIADKEKEYRLLSNDELEKIKIITGHDYFINQELRKIFIDTFRDRLEDYNLLGIENFIKILSDKLKQFSEKEMQPTGVETQNDDELNISFLLDENNEVADDNDAQTEQAETKDIENLNVDAFSEEEIRIIHDKKMKKNTKREDDINMMNDIIQLLKQTPLIAETDLSFNYIYEKLQTYEPSMDSLFFSPDEHADNYNFMVLNSFFGLPPEHDYSTWRYFYFFNVHYKKDNIVKFIYAIHQNSQIKVAHEPLRGNVSSRPTHSELANGLGIEAGGELIFNYNNNILKWNLMVINNGSGHYRPAAHLSLPIAKKAILNSLDKEIRFDSVALLNSLKPGMTLASGFDEENDQIFMPQQDDQEKINDLVNLIDKNRKIYKVTLNQQEHLLREHNTKTSDYQILILYKDQASNSTVESQLYQLTRKLKNLNHEFENLQAELCNFIEKINATENNQQSKIAQEKYYILQNNPNIFFQEISVTGDGWCAMYAAGFGKSNQLSPEQVFENLKLSLDNPEITDLLIKSLENTFQSSLSLNGIFSLDCNDDEGNVILNKITQYYQQLQSTNDELREETLACYISYLGRKDVLTGYLNHLLRIRYADVIIVQAGLSLIGKRLAIFINYGLADERLVNCSADGTDISDPDTVSIILYPTKNPFLAHYNSLNLMMNHTFVFNAENATSVHLAGDFNLWLNAENSKIKLEGADTYLMKCYEASEWKITVSLNIRKYEFKYVIDAERWENDSNEDRYPKINCEYQNSSLDMKEFFDFSNVPSNSNSVFVKAGTQPPAILSGSTVVIKNSPSVINILSDKVKIPFNQFKELSKNISYTSLDLVDSILKVNGLHRGKATDEGNNCLLHSYFQLINAYLDINNPNSILDNFVDFVNYVREKIEMTNNEMLMINDEVQGVQILSAIKQYIFEKIQLQIGFDLTFMVAMNDDIAVVENLGDFQNFFSQESMNIPIRIIQINYNHYEPIFVPTLPSNQQTLDGRKSLFEYSDAKNMASIGFMSVSSSSLEDIADEESYSNFSDNFDEDNDFIISGAPTLS